MKPDPHADTVVMPKPALRRRLAAYRYRRTIGYSRFDCLRYVLTYDPFGPPPRRQIDGSGGDDG